MLFLMVRSPNLSHEPTCARARLTASTHEQHNQSTNIAGNEAKKEKRKSRT